MEANCGCQSASVAYPCQCELHETFKFCSCRAIRVRPETVGLLVAAGAEVDARMPLGPGYTVTALGIALSRGGRPGVVLALIAAGASARVFGEATDLGALDAAAMGGSGADAAVAQIRSRYPRFLEGGRRRASRS